MVEYMGFEKYKRITRKYGNIPETSMIGGKVCNFRSQGEKRLAQYLELLKVGGYIRDWAFEQTTFHFPYGGRYLVDFDVLTADGCIEYYEFKGMFKKSDADNLEKLFMIRPEVRLTMVFEDLRQAAKFARRKVSRFCKLKIQSKAKHELKDFDGKTRRPIKRVKAGCEA